VIVPRSASTRTVPPDAELVAAALGHQTWAAEALFRRYADKVNGLAARLMGRPADADDVVQDAFTQAFASLGELKDPGVFSAWITSIVIRRAHHVLRHRRLLVRLGIERHEPIDVDALVSPAAPPDVAPDIRALYRAIERMPPKLRIPLLLQRVEGMPLRDIAEACGVSLATLKRRIVSAEALLERMLEKGGSR
jgi:RNA polymerase sigma-70 factor, ECF subfamily